MNTLTPNSQEIISQLKGGLTITTYVNILDENNWVGFPENYNEDIRLFEQYTRFKPEIKMQYVLYYDTVKNDLLEQAYPGMTYEEKARKVIERQKLNPRKILTPEKIRERIDLRTTEGNRTVRLLERESGEKTFLRLYNDATIHPTESEISAALKRMVMTDLPTIGFLTGHGERETDRPGDRNYCMFTHLPMLRQSLVNQGFDYQDVTLDREIPADINILVIAEMREAMTEAEKVNFDKYVARGGNLVVIGEPGRQEVMNPVLASFGVKLVDGFLIQPEEETEPQEIQADNMDLGPFAGFTAPKQPIDLILSKPTKEAQKLSYYFSYMIPHYVAVMPTAAGLEYSTDKGFDVIPLFMSDSTCWNELEYTDIVDKEIVYNPAVGEVQKSYPLALALSRKMGAREQKIVVLGDADCLSDGELTRNRKPLWVANYTIIQASFFWLSDYKVPIDVRRPAAADRRINVSPAGAEILNYTLIGGLPGLLFILYMFIWLRRRGR